MTNQSRKERLQGDDAFIHAADEAQQWLGKHRPIAIGALVMVALLAAGGLVVNQLHHRRDAAAADLFAAGFRALDGRLTDPASEAKRAQARAAAKKARAQARQEAKGKGAVDADEADDDDDSMQDDPQQLTFASKKARWQAAKDAFAQAEAARGHVGVGALAGLLAADLEEKLGEREAAEARFDALRHDLQGDARLLFLAVERYADAREAQGDFDGALHALQALTDDHGNFYADRATLHTARIYEAKGDGPKAVALLESMPQNFPRTTLSEEIALRLEALSQTQAQAPAGPAQGQADPVKDRP